MKLPLNGGCVCGAIRYEIFEAPIDIYACHCTDCQRITSSAFSLGVIVAATAFRATGKDARSVPGGIADKQPQKRQHGSKPPLCFRISPIFPPRLAIIDLKASGGVGTTWLPRPVVAG